MMMTPRHVIPLGLKLVIFDCDGVLIDSEATSSRLIAETATACGLPMTPEMAMERFSGTKFSVVKAAIEEALACQLPHDFVDQMQARMIALMQLEAKLMPGVEGLLDLVSAKGLAMRVGSNSSREEMDVKFARTGLKRFFSDDRIHSSFDVARAKPAPDVYLAAARAEGCDVAECLVIEDSFTGAMAAGNAGMACLLLREDGVYPSGAPDNLAVVETTEALRRTIESV